MHPDIYHFDHTTLWHGHFQEEWLGLIGRKARLVDKDTRIDVFAGLQTTAECVNWKYDSKRLFDVASSVILLLLMMPMLILMAILIKLDGGPVFYVHRRVGLRGRIFGCLKFRTMRTDADAVLEAVLRSDPEARDEWKRKRKLRRDPRVTRIGRILRRASLDELPQLVNVLRGTMSLVGPRPVVPDELQQHYNPVAAAAYISVRPGLTGLWQVSGRSETDYGSRIALDCTYIQNKSIPYDVRLLIRTVGVVLGREGAF